MEYNNLYYTLFFISNNREELSMKLNDFIKEFAENHSIQHIDELNGVIVASLTQELYLVNTGDVNE